MAYTNTWSNTSPTGSTPAKQIDEEFRKLRVDIQDRMETIVEDWDDDPIALKDVAGGPVTGKTILVPAWSFLSDNDLSHTNLRVGVGQDSDLYAPVILPIGATITDFQAMLIPGLGTTTVRLGYISHSTSTPSFTTVDSNTQAGGSAIKLVSNSDTDLAHVVATDRYYLLWITCDASIIAPFYIYGVKITYDIDNVKQTL